MDTKRKILCLILSLSVFGSLLHEQTIAARQEIPLVLPSGSAMLAGRFYFSDSVIATSGVVLDDSFCELTEIPPLPFDTQPHLEDNELWASLKLPYKSEESEIANTQSYFGQFGQSKYSDTATVWGVIEDGSFQPRFTLPPWQTYSHGMTFKVTPTLPKMVDVEILDHSRKTQTHSIKGMHAARLPLAVAEGMIVYNTKLFDIRSKTDICPAEIEGYTIKNGYFVNRFAIVNLKTKATADISSLKLPDNYSIQDDCIEFYDKCGDCANFEKLDKPTTITKVGFDGKIIASRTAANIPNDWEVVDTHKSVLLCKSLKPPASDFFVVDEASGKVLHQYQANRENYPKARIENGVACVIDGGNTVSFDIESLRATSRQIGSKGTLFGEPGNLKAVSAKGEAMDIADANKTALCRDIGRTRPARHNGSPTLQFAEDGYIYSFYVEQAHEDVSYEFQISYLKQKETSTTQGKLLFLPEWLTRFQNPEAFAFRNGVLYYAQDYGKLCSVNLTTFEKKNYDHQGVRYPQNFSGVAFVKLEENRLYALYPGRSSILDCVDIKTESHIFSSFLQMRWNSLLGINMTKPFIVNGDKFLLGPIRAAFDRSTGDFREYAGEFVGYDGTNGYFMDLDSQTKGNHILVSLDLKTWQEERKSIDRQEAIQISANSSKMAFGSMFEMGGKRLKFLPSSEYKTLQQGLPKNLSEPKGNPDSFFAVSNSTHLIKFEACPLFETKIETNPDGKATIQFTPVQNGATIPYGKIALVPLHFDGKASLGINFKEVAWQTFNPFKTQKYEFENIKSRRYAFLAIANAGFMGDEAWQTNAIPTSIQNQAAFTMIIFGKNQERYQFDISKLQLDL